MALDLSGEGGAVVLPGQVHPGAGQAHPAGDGGACVLELSGDGVGVLGLGVRQEHHGDVLGGQGPGQEAGGGLSDVGVPLVDGRLSLLELGLGGVAVLTQGGDLVVERGSQGVLQRAGTQDDPDGEGQEHGDERYQVIAEVDHG